jgi:hypothetical protein
MTFLALKIPIFRSQDTGSDIHTLQKRFLVIVLKNDFMVLLEPRKQTNKLRGLNPLSEVYRPSDRRLSAKLVPTFADRGCHVVSLTDPYGRVLGFLDR